MDCDAYRDRMLDLLYGEASDATRRALEVHHAACAACAEEYAALRGVRRDLASWTLPQAPRARVRARTLPWPGLAAAAAVLLGLGAALGSGGAAVRHDAQGWTFSLGRPQGDLEGRLAAQERRHQQDLQELRAQVAAASGRVAPASFDEARFMDAVRTLVEQSERRQDDRLRQSLVALGERTDSQRRNDLAMISASLSDLDSKSGLRDARTNELMGQVLLASQEK